MYFSKVKCHRILIFCIALVWVINGLFCKVLNLVPRHQLIVARILGNEYAGFFTKAIGVAEIIMAAWVMSRIAVRLNAITQIAIVVIMNIIEFALAPDLLLFGKANMLFALLFAGVVYVNAFQLLGHETDHG